MIAYAVARLSKLGLARLSVSTVFLINGAGIDFWAAYIPLVARRFELNDDFVGLVLLSLGLGAMAAMPVAGWACGRFGSRKVTRIAAFVFAIVIPLPILTPSLLLLFLAALGFGACNGALDVAMNSQASEIETARGRSTMASFHAFFSAGGLAGAALGGLTIAVGLGDARGAALMAVLAAVLLSMTLPHLFSSPAAQSDTPHFAKPRPVALSLGLLALASMIVEGAVADWSGLLLTKHAGATPAFGAAGYTFFSIAMMTCRFAGDSLIDAFGPRRMMVAGGLSIAMGLSLAASLSTPLPAAASFVLVGLGAANVIPALFAAASRIQGLPAGSGIAAVATIGYAGFLLGPPVIGWIASVIGLPAAHGVMALAGVLIVFFARTVDR